MRFMAKTSREYPIILLETSGLLQVKSYKMWMLYTIMRGSAQFIFEMLGCCVRKCAAGTCKCWCEAAYREAIAACRRAYRAQRDSPTASGGAVKRHDAKLR